MNAGIADANNLAWLLAAVFDGWASPGILDAYEAERLPITEQVSHFAMDMALKVLSQHRSVPVRHVAVSGATCMRWTRTGNERR